MLKFKFDFQKTVQAAAVLLRNHGKRMEYLRLLKLLYIADRELLSATGRPLTGDQAYAMDHGPVLSRVYDLIKQQGTQAGAWDSFVHKDGYHVRLVEDPGSTELNRGEVAKLVELCERFHDVGTWELIEYTHEFAEWKTNYKLKTSTKYAWDEVLKAEGREAMIPAIECDLAARQALDAAFGG